MTGGSLAERARLAQHLAGTALRGALGRLYASPAYRWRFGGGRTPRLAVAPQDLRNADSAFAANLAEGRVFLAGELVKTHGLSPFEIDEASDEWFASLHGFGWLRHLRAASGPLARAQARTLVADWLALRPLPDEALDPAVTARRIIAWISHSPVVLEEADHALYRRFVRSIRAQARYLRRAAADARDGRPKLLAAIALTYAGLCLTGQARLARQAVRWLQDELERQILPDGGHVSRDPRAVLDILLDLLPLRQTFTARSIPPPPALVAAIERMMPMLRFFRHADGAVAGFNGATTYPADLLAAVLAYDDSRGAPLKNAAHSGYQRIEAEDVVLIADTGRPPALPFSTRAHAGCLSFELSAGRYRLIVNCGHPEGLARNWTQAARATAAHSTLVLDDTSSARFASGRRIEARVGQPIVSGPRRVMVARSDRREATALTASHDGYVRTLGLIHERRLTLDHAGTRLDGEDHLLAAEGATPSAREFAIRFHLHPAVRAARVAENAILLLAPSGDGWVMEAQAHPITVEESVYLPEPRGVQRSLQLVLRGRPREQDRVRWAFRRVLTAADMAGYLDQAEALARSRRQAQD